MSAVHPQTRKTFFIAAIILFNLAVLGNVISSQTISSTYTQVLDGNKKGVVYYLTHIRSLPIFTTELLRYKEQFGAVLETSVFEKEVKRKNEILGQEALLLQNPQVRDALFNLASLYKEAGDRTKSAIYLKRARAVDPSVK